MPSALLESPEARETTLFPFYHQIVDGDRKGNLPMSREDQLIAVQDYEDCRHMVDYRRQCGWDAKAKRGMAIYNVVQTMTPEDEVSRVFIGYSRMIIDKGIEQMTEGEPDFSFEPFGPSDHMKTVIWKHLMKMVLSKCDYKLHQETFFRDYFVMGSAVFEIFIDYPQRTVRVPKDDGSYESVVVQDFRRPKVGVRAVNPMHCWRNPNIESSSQVPSCLKRRVITWNQFAQEFGRCTVDGKLKYDNLEKIAKGTHVCLYYYQDEIRDVYRIYAQSFGNEPDAFASVPEFTQMGIKIFDKPLKIHEKVIDGVVQRSTGLNISGSCSLRWGTFFDAYDKQYEGTHRVYGMGLPERLEGEDTVMQTIFNINLDNYRWANTVALNYKGSNADSYMDVDANRLYGAELIDGEITPQPLGIARIGDFQAMQESIDRTSIPSSGINHQQMVGDTSKTAFEFSQRIRLANRSAEQRLIRLENEVFKPMGSLLLANSLSTLTVKEYEAMTEQEAERARESVKANRKPLGDYEGLDTEEPKRRVITYLPIRGEKIREDFSITRKRKLDYDAPFDAKGRSTNTLIRDPDMKVETSYIPLTEEYVYPAEYIESGILPDCIVDSKRMLGDLKSQDAQNFKAATDFLLQILQLEMQVNGKTSTDFDKIKAETLEFAGIDPKRILKTDEEGSKVLSEVKSLLERMQQTSQPTSPPANAPMAPAPMAPAPSPPKPGGQGNAQDPLQAAATGGL